MMVNENMITKERLDDIIERSKMSIAHEEYTQGYVIIKADELLKIILELKDLRNVHVEEC